ncbi:murein DD-endopeptidase MepM/ murein hydrolase activator NlpD [Melghirimyces profundicolus]|uniref:Murein DD-endopeptidase MepM/ murein hydrolase activator NlpD n=1 Tax=Melghirimyces profundicolus TaxID=1242148 RepID=A0A2T6B461_9BACL|nr:M23 family metallopeptidase [Melghirimyces profundicolus]PTX50867.1 murein DD-endopeptidase MepM/ murein hydrolase activator NlpD [Melghirimyces profundicolus]
MKILGEGGWQRTAISLAAALGLAFSVWPAGLVHADKEDEVRQNIEDNKQKQEAKEKEIEEVKQEVDKLKKKLEPLEKELEKIKIKEDAAEEDLEKAKKELDKYDDQYKASVRSMYIHGGANQMESLLSADSFEQFLARFEFLRLIIKQDFSQVQKYYDAKERAEKARDKVLKTRKEKEKKMKEIEKDYDKMVDLLQKNRSALAQLEEKEMDYRKTLSQLNLENLRTGEFPFQGPLRKPVNGPVTSGYGYRGSEFHTGVDFSGDIGTPIYAAGNGRVVRAQTCGCGYGYYIMIYHGGGVYTLYAHSYSWQSKVSVGDVVKKGQLISAIGNNGRSTGPHLHLEVHVGRPGNYVNPRQYIPY